jgi:hypothetical protein
MEAELRDDTDQPFERLHQAIKPHFDVVGMSRRPFGDQTRQSRISERRDAWAD